MTDQSNFPESDATFMGRKRQRRGFGAAKRDEMSHAAISRHIKRYVGSSRKIKTLNELGSDIIHIDVYVVDPTPDRNYFTLITSGMSDLPMAIPKEYEYARYAEMVVCLPPTWDLTEEALRDDCNYWPIRWIETMPKLTHITKSWLCPLRVISNGEPPTPYAENTELSCAFIFSPILFDLNFAELKVRENKTISFLSFIPLYQEESKFLLKHDINLFRYEFDAAEITELLDINRENFCKKKF